MGVASWFVLKSSEWGVGGGVMAQLAAGVFLGGLLVNVRAASLGCWYTF